ncbi:hypothetical protein Tco_0987093 [Tanacetum coccineum]
METYSPPSMVSTIRNASYYNAYMEMVTKHDRKIAVAKGGKKKLATKADQSKKPTTAKQSKPVSTKQSKPAPAKKPKAAQEKPSEPPPTKQSKRGKVRKVRKGKSPLKLIDEDEEVHHEPEPQGEGEEYDVERAIQMSLELFQAHVEGKGKGIATDEQAAQSLLELQTPKKKSTTDQYIFQRRVPATQDVTTRPSTQPEDDTSANMVHESPSSVDAETSAAVELSVSKADTKILSVGEELPQGEEVSKMVTLEERTVDLDEGQVGSDPGKSSEPQPPPEHEVMKEDQAGSNHRLSYVALAGPDPKPMHDDFVATVYPLVHKSLKHTTEEHIHLENPLSSSGTLSFMKNLDETFRDQFFNDKPTKEPRKENVETKVESMVIVPIYQASSTAPPLSTPIIDLSPPKPVSTSAPEPIFTATTTTTTTTLPLLPPPQQQSTTESLLASHVSALEQVCANFEKRYKLQDKTVQGLSSRVFTSELRDLPHKIDETVNEAVKEAVQIALQAPLKERFKDLSEANMKEILHDRMFESGSYRSQPEHVAFYEALKASMKRDNRDEFLIEKHKSRKRRRDDQDPPPPPTNESKQSNKKKRHDPDASGSKQPLPPQSSTWKTSDTREAPSSSSKQKSIPHSEQPVNEVPIPDDVNVLDLEDTDNAHLPKIKNIPDWLKLVPEEDRPKTLEPDWIGKSKLSKADLEGPAYKVVSAFHSNCISLQFQMEECHLLLTDQIDLVNPEGNRLVPDVGKPLPLGGPLGQVTIQPQFFFNKDLEYLVSGSQERRNALSIYKLKAAYYLDFGLEELVPSLWIESEQEYDISAAYGITHYLKTYERYGYTFLKEIFLRRADYNEYKISEADFKNLHPNDFEDMYLR